MSEKITRIRRKRRIRSFPDVKAFHLLRRHFSPARVALYIVSLSVIVVLGVILGTYGSKVYSSWREARWLGKANSMLEKKDFATASRLARQVLDVHRDSLPAFYILAEATEKENLEETVSWRAQIARLQPNNVDSQLNLASAALRFGQIDLARRTLEKIAALAHDQAAYHVVAGWLSRAQGNVAEQEQHFAAAVEKEPKNDLYQFNLAALQIHSPDAQKSTHARKELERLTKAPPFRTGAVRALLNDAVERNDTDAADRLAQDLQMSPQVTFADYLLCLTFYRKLDQKKFDALLEKVKPVAARNPTDLGLLMDWMNENGLASEVVKWMEKLPADSTDKPPAAIAIAEAFAAIKNWSRLRRWTRSESWGNDDFLRLGYQAYAARESRQSSADVEFDSLWYAAQHTASEQPEREVKLARLASKWNLPIEAEELWLRLSRNPSTRREALDALFRLYRASNDVKRLYEVLQRLHETSPNENAITASLARLGLNIDKNTKQAQELAKQAYDNAPNDVNCALTYAFSLYVQGRTRDGLDVIRKLPPEALHDPHSAVYVAVILMDENQTDAAKEYIQLAKRGPIYAEEKRLMEDELAKIAGTTRPSPTPTSSPATSAAPTPLPAAKSPPAVNESAPTPASTVSSSPSSDSMP